MQNLFLKFWVLFHLEHFIFGYHSIQSILSLGTIPTDAKLLTKFGYYSIWSKNTFGYYSIQCKIKFGSHSIQHFLDLFRFPTQVPKLLGQIASISYKNVTGVLGCMNFVPQLCKIFQIKKCHGNFQPIVYITWNSIHGTFQS